MSLFRVKTTECRIGVVGQYNAGKTVLLTSLINHLEHHDPDRFRLGDGSACIRRFVSQKPDVGWSAFHYSGFRDALVHRGKWPQKTRDRSQYVCQFERSDWSYSDVLLKLYDLPGERFADAAMLDRSFAEWSDHILTFITNDTPYRNCCQPYLQALTEEPEEATLLMAYKLALAHLTLEFKPLITPSTFLLDTSGSVAKMCDAQELAASRQVGWEPGAEFTPLSAEFRQANPELTARFAERFDRYRTEIVVPFLNALRSCHSLIVLVDIQMILAAGVGMYDDNRQILRDLFQVLDPGESMVGRVGRNLANLFLPHSWRPGWITRVAFVAPKMDLVHPSDRDRMELLLKRLVGKLAEDRDGLHARYFNCSAVVSARMLPSEQGRVLVGIPYRDAEGRRLTPGAEQQFTVSELPDDWPQNWQPGQFTFPEVYPAVPNRKDCPPDQINLDRVLDFVLD